MEWTAETLDSVLDELRARRGDTTSIEVKRAAGGLPNLTETLCAFANMPEGGTIILGVDEAGGDFNITGVEDVASLEARVISANRQSVRPCPTLEPHTIRCREGDVLVIEVIALPLKERPAVTRGHSYLRQSDGDYRMQDHELRMIEVAKLHVEEQVDYDLTPAHGRNREDLIPELVEAYLKEVRAQDRRLRGRTDEQILQLTNVLKASGEPTLAGLYALGDYPQGQYPSLTVTAAVQLPGGEGSPRNRNLQDFTGPVPVLLAEVMEWVEDNLDIVRRYRPDGHMESVAELPLNAVRELVANALVHRDLGPNTLGTGKGIQVRLRPDALFIQSPGGLRGVSLEQLESVEHAQAAVNQRLYQMAKKLKLPDGAAVIEGEGGGIREVFRSVADRGLPRPKLTDASVRFTAWLSRAADRSRRRDEVLPPRGVPERKAAVDSPAGLPMPASSRPTRHESHVLRLLVESGAMPIRELARTAGLSVSQIRYALARPIAEGLVVMEGRQGQRDTRYRVVEGSRIG